jgi:hypothetical protein
MSVSRISNKHRIGKDVEGRFCERIWGAISTSVRADESYENFEDT